MRTGKSNKVYQSLVAAFILIAEARAVEPQVSPKNMTLEASRVATVGSQPYRDAVTAFLTGAAPKIVGGQLASEGAYPFQVSLSVSWIANPYYAHFCGGSIYEPHWIITAAHCVIDTPPENIVIVAGTNKLSPGVMRHNVRRVLSHKYDKSTSDNDIALLELKDPLVVTQNIQTIALVTAEEEDAVLTGGSTLVVTGWGSTQEGGQTVRDLRFVNVPFVEREVCNAPLGYNSRITENMICAGELAGGKDSCQGDSGGPLAVKNEKFKIAGIVNWGDGCARPNKVGVYTRITKYAKWIKDCIANPDTCQ